MSIRVTQTQKLAYLNIKVQQSLWQNIWKAIANRQWADLFISLVFENPNIYSLNLVAEEEGGLCAFMEINSRFYFRICSSCEYGIKSSKNLITSSYASEEETVNWISKQADCLIKKCRP